MPQPRPWPMYHAPCHCRTPHYPRGESWAQSVKVGQEWMLIQSRVRRKTTTRQWMRWPETRRQNATYSLGSLLSGDTKAEDTANTITLRDPCGTQSISELS